MAKKKSQDEAPSPCTVHNRDIMQRLNYLYQASVLLSSAKPFPADNTVPTVPMPASKTSGTSHRQQCKREMLEQRNPSTAVDLARTYVRSMKVIGKKTTVRMDPTVKRTLCKKCAIVLVPGSTALVRVKSSGPHGHVVLWTCLACKTTRRIPAPAEPRPDPNPSHTQGVPITAVAQGPSDDHKTISIAGIKRKKKTITREPPLFARKDAGHIVFRGNERLN
ncbi:RNAse P Rpr2/Rpp21/SNM1 subunit domain-containing protein [Cytidiella melzeri]|nr:RNAse P Rpr2/Rpp21/SNM1 subunit domain-containing protein [Cytidiella melzeri]